MVVLVFRGKVNKDFLWVNEATFQMVYGGTVTVDRTDTEYDIDENGNFVMRWINPYLTRVNGIHFCDYASLNEDFFREELVNDEGVEGVTLEVEEDAGADYKVELTEWWGER